MNYRGFEPVDDKKIFSATALIINDDGNVLAVSRKNDPNDFGLPGGKREAHETPEQTCRRELEEETGLVAISMSPVYDRPDAADSDKFCRCFLIESYGGNIKTKESGVIKWVEPKVITQGTFGFYNTGLLEARPELFQPRPRHLWTTAFGHSNSVYELSRDVEDALKPVMRKWAGSRGFMPHEVSLLMMSVANGMDNWFMTQWVKGKL